MTRRPTVSSVADELFGRLAPDVVDDLRDEDPGAAVELHFGPVRLQPLPSRSITSGDCSTDGYYEAEIDPSTPWIVFADDVAPARQRFTILHELGHHLLATDSADLLDDIDVVGESSSGATRVEESICHRLAGQILVPGQLVQEVLQSERPLPRHVAEIRKRCGASWDAVAIQTARHLEEPAAIVLLREGGVVALAAASSRLGANWWPGNSVTDPHGPLRNALDRRYSATLETYRFGLSYARRMYCDSEPVGSHLAIAVLTDFPSDGRVNLVDQPEPAWRDRLVYCEHCGGDRTVDWCERCNGRFCRDCGRCACLKPIRNPTCIRCGFMNPHHPGASVCVDCEADG